MRKAIAKGANRFFWTYCERTGVCPAFCDRSFEGRVSSKVQLVVLCEDKVRMHIQKKRRIVIPTTQSLLNLKSNTMKNTVQRYCFFLYLPNILTKKYVLQHVFYNFAICKLQNSTKMWKNLPISKNSSNFVPEKVGHFPTLMLRLESRLSNPEK